MTNNNPCHILLAQDDPKTSTHIASYLHKESFSTTVAIDGEDALKIFSIRKPQFVILDVMLPKVNGSRPIARYRKT